MRLWVPRQPAAANHQRNQRRAAFLVGLGLLLAPLVILYAGHFKAEQRQAMKTLSEMTPDNVTAISFSPDPSATHLPSPPFALPIIITDPAEIAAILDTVQTAPRYSPNHPQVLWTCRMRITATSGAAFFGTIHKTNSQGIYLQVTKSADSGMNLAQLRVDAIDAHLP